MSSKNKYSAKDIKELKWNEAIRLRPGMYIGFVDIRGFLDILKGTLIDTLPDLGANYVLLELKDNYSGRLNIRKMKREVKESSSFLKRHYSTENFILGELQILNALSSEFSIQYFDKNEEALLQQNFEKGEMKKGEIKHQILECHSIEIEFKLDKGIWGEEMKLNKDFIIQEIRELSYLYKKVKFEIIYKVEEEACKTIFQFKNGLKDQLEFMTCNIWTKNYFEYSFDEKIEDFSIEAAFAFGNFNGYNLHIKSYVNNQLTLHNGTHVDGVLKGLILGIKKYIRKYQLEGSYRVTKKILKNNLMLILNIRLKYPILENAMRSVLANKEIVKPLMNHCSEFIFKELEKNKVFADKLLSAFEKPKE